MQIVVLTEKGVAGADELRQLAGWNQTREDWARLLSLEPEGCFAAMEEGRVIGTVTTTTFGQQLAWIGMMLVHPDCRRRGIGTRLMERALEYLRGRKVDCIRLDATPAGYPVYEKLGFVPEWTLTRQRRDAAPGVTHGVHEGIRLVTSAATAGVGEGMRLVNSAATPDTRDLQENDWVAVERIDAAAFGVSRLAVLRVFAESRRRVLVWPAGGGIHGYGMLRRGSQCDYLGPLVCLDRDGGMSLVSALVAAAGSRPVFWDVPDENALAQFLAKQFGFRPVRPLTRMRLGPGLARSDPPGEGTGPTGRMRLGVASVRSDPAAQLGIADPSVG